MKNRSVPGFKLLLILQQTFVGTRPPSNSASAQWSDSESLAMSIDFRGRARFYRLGRVRYYPSPGNIIMLSWRIIIEQLLSRSGVKTVSANQHITLKRCRAVETRDDSVGQLIVSFEHMIEMDGFLRQSVH